MTERERWVVYPLLFLALGAALRDKLVDRTTTKSIICQELTVVDEETDGRQPARVIARIGRSEGTGNGPGPGLMYVNGELAVDGVVSVKGPLNVDGIVNAKQYALLNMLFTPPLQAFGITVPDLLRAIQAAQQSQQLNQQKGQPSLPQPPVSPAPENKSGGAGAPATTDTDADAPAQK